MQLNTSADLSAAEHGFYEAPLVSDVACADGAVTLTAHNVFKMNGWRVEPG